MEMAAVAITTSFNSKGRRAQADPIAAPTAMSQSVGPGARQVTPPQPVQEDQSPFTQYAREVRPRQSGDGAQKSSREPQPGPVRVHDDEVGETGCGGRGEEWRCERQGFRGALSIRGQDSIRSMGSCNGGADPSHSKMRRGIQLQTPATPRVAVAGRRSTPASPISPPARRPPPSAGRAASALSRAAQPTRSSIRAEAGRADVAMHQARGG